MVHDIYCAGGCKKILASVETDDAKNAARHQTIMLCHDCSPKIQRPDRSMAPKDQQKAMASDVVTLYKKGELSIYQVMNELVSIIVDGKRIPKDI